MNATTLNDLIQMIDTMGGRIVSSNDLTHFQIVEAQACKRFHVDDRGYGYAFLPWRLTTEKDENRHASRRVTA